MKETMIQTGSKQKMIHGWNLMILVSVISNIANLKKKALVKRLLIITHQPGHLEVEPMVNLATCYFTNAGRRKI